MLVDSKAILYMLTERFGLKRVSLADRIKLQKTIYLLQVCGFERMYGFGWFKYGPYSQDLVYDAYYVLTSEKNTYEQQTKKWQFSSESKSKFERFETICKDILDNSKMLELVASVDFVRTVWLPVWHPDAADSNITKIFKQYKTQYFDNTPIEDKDILEATKISKKLRAVQN